MYINVSSHHFTSLHTTSIYVHVQIMVIWTRIHTRYGTRAQELDGRQLVHDVPALFVHSRESEVVFNLELRQDLRIEQAGNLADQSTE